MLHTHIFDFDVDKQCGLLRTALASNPTIIQFIPSPNYNERPPGTIIDLLVIHNISLPRGVFGTNAITALFCNQHVKLDIHMGEARTGVNPGAIAETNSEAIAAELIALKVSAHLLIRRDGTIIQYVPLTARAWHAGTSSFQGRENCNDFSIGIELEGTDDIPYEDVQYERLRYITLALMRAYPGITVERIVGHCDISPQRKTDPGASFDWQRYRAQLS